MIERLIALCLRRRAIVWMAFLAIAVYGVVSFEQMPLEAYPDIADAQAQIVTKVPGLAAEDVEQQITIPIERAIANTPGLAVMRSESTFALSLVSVVFTEGTEDYWARLRLREQLSGLSLPYGAQPSLDPLTSPTGEIYRYTLESSTRSLRELSELQFWTVIPRLKQVPGVADVTNFGGLTTQFQLLLDPARLVAYGLTLSQVTAAIKANNSNAGGSVVNRGEQGFVVRGVGLIADLEDLAQVVVSSGRNGVPVRIGDLGTVSLGSLERHGILGMDRQRDHIEGIVLLLKHQSESQTLRGLHAAVDELNASGLPPDVKLVPLLDRSSLVHATEHTVAVTLSEGMALVVLVLLLFLGSPRAAAIVALTVPLALLFAFVLMHWIRVPVNLLSLGAADFGILVDGAIVVLENTLRHREEAEGRVLSLREAYLAAIQVGRPVFFAVLIIITAYLPLFFFEHVEYHLFAPMAYALGFSLLGALLVALTLVPGLAYAAYHRPRRVFRNRVMERISYRYRHWLLVFIHRTRFAVGVTAAVLLGTALLGFTAGRDFLPELDEGSIWLQVALPQSVSLEKAAQMADALREATLEFPEVAHVVTQVGRNDDGTDSFTPSHIECAVTLHPYGEWKSGLSKAGLIERLQARYKRMPGYDVGFTQPMIDGINDQIAGAHSQLVIKIFGNDFAGLRRIAGEVQDTLRQIRGASDVGIDQEPPSPQLRVSLDRRAAARYGLNADDVSALISSGVSGAALTQIYVGERVYDIVVRFSGASRDDPQKLGELELTSPGGARVALSQIARVEVRSGESVITREMSRRHLSVTLNLRGRDLGGFYDEAAAAVEKNVRYDHRAYRLAWGGQYDSEQRAQRRLFLIVPLTLGLMFVLLFSAFGTVRHAALILLSVPLAAVGGFVAIQLRGMTLNVSSAVGFIALFGVAIQNAIIMVASLNRWRGLDATLLQAVLKGARERFRPVLITATVAVVGLLPAAVSHSLGSDVQRPLATVIIGGLLTATALTLLLLPTLYFWVETWAQRRLRLRPPDRDRSLDDYFKEEGA
ncbi:MAG TPA: CusA/CzcA family heavy metal efflux RND transporter [Nevskia sp.]|nr:CusA/CzcA family heavy metal efflux RND transporter [Nevskia sp.]